jgi:hypothetical protein
MTSTTWILSEPNPNLSLTINKIDPTKLDFDDIYWIYSSMMKQYIDEFNKLEGFIDIENRLIQENTIKLQKKRIYKQVINSYKPSTPST